jgi:hypothetical protein
MRYLHQFLTHKAVDAVQEVQWETDKLNLKVVDEEFNGMVVSAFLTAGQAKLMLLHDKSISASDNTKHFFREVYELYVKWLLNPFYVSGSPIKSEMFRTKVRALSKKHL